MAFVIGPREKNCIGIRKQLAGPLKPVDLYKGYRISLAIKIPKTGKLKGGGFLFWIVKGIKTGVSKGAGVLQKYPDIRMEKRRMALIKAILLFNSFYCAALLSAVAEASCSGSREPMVRISS